MTRDSPDDAPERGILARRGFIARDSLSADKGARARKRRRTAGRPARREAPSPAVRRLFRARSARRRRAGLPPPADDAGAPTSEATVDRSEQPIRHATWKYNRHGNDGEGMAWFDRSLWWPLLTVASALACHRQESTRPPLLEAPKLVFRVRDERGPLARTELTI